MIDGLLALLAGYLLLRRGGQGGAPIIAPSKPKTPEQVPFPKAQPVPPPRGPIVLDEILITPSPGVLPASSPAVTPGPALPPAAPVAKKRAVEVFRVHPLHHGKSIDEMKRQWPAGWQPSHPPSSAEIAKAQSLLPGWRKGGLHWDQSAGTTAGLRAYVYREH